MTPVEWLRWCVLTGRAWYRLAVDDMWRWVARHLPHRLARWAYLRVASTAALGGRLTDLTVIDALNWWDHTRSPRERRGYDRRDNSGRDGC